MCEYEQFDGFVANGFAVQVGDARMLLSAICLDKKYLDQQIKRRLRKLFHNILYVLCC